MPSRAILASAAPPDGLSHGVVLLAASLATGQPLLGCGLANGKATVPMGTPPSRLAGYLASRTKSWPCPSQVLLGVPFPMLAELPVSLRQPQEFMPPSASPLFGDYFLTGLSVASQEQLLHLVSPGRFAFCSAPLPDIHAMARPRLPAIKNCRPASSSLWSLLPAAAAVPMPNCGHLLVGGTEGGGYSTPLDAVPRGVPALVAGEGCPFMAEPPWGACDGPTCWVKAAHWWPRPREWKGLLLCGIHSSAPLTCAAVSSAGSPCCDRLRALSELSLL